MNAWTPLGDVLERVERAVVPVPGESYRQVGVHWWGFGPYEREQVDGSDVRAPALFRLADGDVLINKIWARHGAVGSVPAQLEGAFVSAEFPTLV